MFKCTISVTVSAQLVHNYVSHVHCKWIYGYTSGLLFYCNTYTSILWILNYTFKYFWIKRL